MNRLSDLIIGNLISKTLPSFHNINPETNNLGFGYLFYSFVRTLRPKNVVVIGSKGGFSPILFALGLLHNKGSGHGKIECYNTENEINEFGQLHFIDPSYSVERNDTNHYYGIGNWDNKEKVIELWKEFGVEKIITHFKLTSADYLSNEKAFDKIDLLYIDGDHSYGGMMHDFIEFSHLLSEKNMIIAHDVDPQISLIDNSFGGDRAYSDLPDSFEKVRIPVFPGLAIIRKKSDKNSISN